VDILDFVFWADWRRLSSLFTVILSIALSSLHLWVC
jgi:hypothetical protein